MGRRMSALLLVVLVVGGCTGGIERSTEVLRSPRAVPTGPSETGTPSPAGSPTVGAERPIVLRAPRAGDLVENPVAIRGIAISADGVVTIALLDADGNLLAAMDADVSCGADCRGRFGTELGFFTPVQQGGTVVASVRGGTDVPAHSVRVAVTLLP